ncbi:MAG: aspartyl protease [Symploca sp. SIO1B1]|nr:aspartyl protease [Symploca sp. SIO1C2]NER48652.1 aspartyl protease [Symploca sp. SIO1A3]NER95272.1 aspartyl protease [Symploca sp. SIO1B1]
MIVGRFGENGELFFEIELIAANDEHFAVEAILDTGFTTGWLAINDQDIEALQWLAIDYEIEMITARGSEPFELYEGRVIIDNQEFTIPVHVGEELPDILIGSQWLEIIELIVKKRQGTLTLEVLKDE